MCSKLHRQIDQPMFPLTKRCRVRRYVPTTLKSRRKLCKWIYRCLVVDYHAKFAMSEGMYPSAKMDRLARELGEWLDEMTYLKPKSPEKWLNDDAYEKPQFPIEEIQEDPRFARLLKSFVYPAEAMVIPAEWVVLMLDRFYQNLSNADTPRSCLHDVYYNRGGQRALDMKLILEKDFLVSTVAPSKSDEQRLRLAMLNWRGVMASLEEPDEEAMIEDLEQWREEMQEAWGGQVDDQTSFVFSESRDYFSLIEPAH